MRFAVNGWVEPWLPEAAHQNQVVGGAVIAAATEFAHGGYTVVIDGFIFPDALEELAHAFVHRSVPLHYVVLRCDLGTCWKRATGRDSGEPLDRTRFARLHARFDDLGSREPHALDAAGAPGEVAAAALTSFRSGRLAVDASRRP